MPTLGTDRLVLGIFKRELKNRFLCEVEINNQANICYVPSSCHLSNFLSLENKKVILIPTSSKNTRTHYSLLALPYKRSYILLNYSLANKAIENSIKKRRFSFLGKRSTIQKEKHIENYKADFLIEDSQTILEIKSLITTDKEALFPTVYSERALKQYKQLFSLMDKGYSVNYFIVSLNPYVKAIRINKESEFYNYYCVGKNKGITFRAFSCRLVDEHPVIDKEIPVIEQ